MSYEVSFKYLGFHFTSITKSKYVFLANGRVNAPDPKIIKITQNFSLNFFDILV